MIEVIGLIIGLLSIPGSIYALIVFWQDFRSSPDDPVGIQAKISNAIRLHDPQQERILLEFDRKNFNTAETLENETYKLAQKCPFPTFREAMIYNPRGLMEMANAQYTMLTLVSGVFLRVAFLFLALFVFLPRPSDVSDLGMWGHFQRIMVGAGSVLGPIIVSYFAGRYAFKFRQVREAARSYRSYLHQHGISVAVEFTQLRRYAVDP